MTDPRTTIARLYVVGVLLLIAGAVLAGFAWPGENTTTVFTGTADEVAQKAATGSVYLAAVGLVIAGVGQVCLTVGIIASGVRLGRRD